MFERYTEKARRVIFFSRYEASQLGSPYIETEHILLGIVREERNLVARFLPPAQADSIRPEIESRVVEAKPTATSVDLSLSDESKRVLAYAAEESDRLGDLYIGAQHLLLGLLREANSFAAILLQERGLEIGKVREELSRTPHETVTPHTTYRVRQQGYRSAALETIEIHGQPRNADYIRRSAKQFCEISWHWEKRTWTPRDVVIHRKTQRLSLDGALAENRKGFDLVKDGWTKDHCAICRWALFASKDAPEHATGYTNGRDWLCTECYDKFIARSDFFSSNYPDIT